MVSTRLIIHLVESLGFDNRPNSTKIDSEASDLVPLEIVT